MQFPYHPILSGIKYFSKVFCSCRLFLYPHMVTLPTFLQILLFKHILHCLTFILYLPSIVIFCFLRSYGTMYLDRILSCPTWINLFTLFISSIFFNFCLGLPLFNKYCQCIYKSWDISFICCCLYQTPEIAAKSTMLQLYLLIPLNILLQIFSNLLGTTYRIDLQYRIFVGLY